MVQKLMWSGVYLRSTLSNTLFQKLLSMVPLTATGPEVFFATMTKFLSNYYDALEDILTHMKRLKLKTFQGRTVHITVQKYW